MMVQGLKREIGSFRTQAFIHRILRRIAHYRDSCRFTIILANPYKVIPLARYAVTHRLRLAENLEKQYELAGLCPFEAVMVTADEATRVIFPPIVELRNEGHCIMDGVHRFMAAQACGLNAVSCVQVEGESLPALPCDPISWEEIRVQDEQMPLESILPGLKRALFRPLTSLFNSTEFTFCTGDEALRFVDGVYVNRKQKKGVDHA